LTIYIILNHKYIENLTKSKSVSLHWSSNQTPSSTILLDYKHDVRCWVHNDLKSSKFVLEFSSEIWPNYRWVCLMILLLVLFPYLAMSFSCFREVLFEFGSRSSVFIRSPRRKIEFIFFSTRFMKWLIKNHFLLFRQMPVSDRFKFVFNRYGYYLITMWLSLICFGSYYGTCVICS